MFLYPTLSVEVQAFIRIAYGVLLLLTLGAALPHARRYFVTERWAGYAQSSRLANLIQHPNVMPVVLLTWVVAALGLAAGRAIVPAAIVNLACCYYFFNRMRWRSLLRGMGAPGFIAMWLGAAVCALELTSRYAPGARATVLLALQIDFGAIMVSAGLYKLFAGYRRSQGMELGMVNPVWGYWPSFWRTWAPRHPLFRFLDEMAWSTEVVCGLLMLFPATRALGALGILLSFIFIATQIRLGWLCEMVIVCCFLFAGGTIVEDWLVAVLAGVGAPPTALPPSWAGTAEGIVIAICWGYLALLPLVRGGMFYNQLRHRALPAPLQRALDGYANLFGLILWRVFTADVVNFFVRIWEQPLGGSRRLVSDFTGTGWSRFSQVAECITLTSVFTTLRYYPSNRALFVSRLVRYARTIPRAAGSSLVFEWVHVGADRQFEYVPVAEFTVDVDAGTVSETVINDQVSVRVSAPGSPIHEGGKPGSYAPLGT